MTVTYGNPVDYIGRVFDLLVLPGAIPTGRAQLSQELFSNEAGGTVCTGVQKLAQRWVIQFLTIQGSIPFYPDEGTDFVAQIRRGELQNEARVLSAFSIAAVRVRDSLLAEETDDMHPEDRMGNATLEDVTISPEWISLRVTLTSLAGTSRRVILPIPYLPIHVG